MFNKEKFSEILTKIYNTYNNQRDFADSTGVNRAYLSQYINQKLDNPPSPKVLMKIANNSNGITTYEELMEICGFLIDSINKNLNEIRNAGKTLEYNNMIKKLSLSEKEENIVNKINASFDNYNKNNSIEESEKKSLNILENIDTSNCDISKIKKATKTYIISQCAKTVINRIYKNVASIDTQYNYIETMNKLNSLSEDIEINNNKKYYMCPVYNQFNPKENPNWETNSIQGRIPLDIKMFNISDHENCFFIKINYDSMNYIIKNGQYALIQKQSSYTENDIILIAGPMFGKVILRKCVQIKDNIVLLATECDGAELSMIDINVNPLTVIGKFIGKIEINQQNT